MRTGGAVHRIEYLVTRVPSYYGVHLFLLKYICTRPSRASHTKHGTATSPLLRVHRVHRVLLVLLVLLAFLVYPTILPFHSISQRPRCGSKSEVVSLSQQLTPAVDRQGHVGRPLAMPTCQEPLRPHSPCTTMPRSRRRCSPPSSLRAPQPRRYGIYSSSTTTSITITLLLRPPPPPLLPPC